VLVIGGGEVSSGRIKNVLVADARVTLIAPADGLHPLTRYFVENSDRVIYHDRVFSGYDDLEGVDMVLSAIDDVEESQRICTLCRERKIPVNVADIPPMCDFYFGSQVRRGPLQILISTNGNGPKLANVIKTRIETVLPPSVRRAVENVGVLRSKLRGIAPGTGGEVSKRRMQWMTKVCTSWTLEELAEMDGNMMDELLSVGWPNNRALARRGDKNEDSKSYSRVQLFERFLPATLGFAVGMCTTLAMLHLSGIRRTA